MNDQKLNYNNRIIPELDKLHTWEHYAADQQLETEYRQSEEEGLDVAAYKPLFDTVRNMPQGEFRDKFADLLGELVLNLPTREGYKYNEPSDLEGIQALRDLSLWQQPEVDVKDLRDKLTGAWYGRICGCLLGKPIEGIRTPEFHQLLKASGNFPMHRYIVSSDIHTLDTSAFKYGLEGNCYADTVDGMPPDDDTNYTVLYQVLVDQKGRDFTPDDCMHLWLDNQPKRAYCTAERVAFCNFVKGFRPPQSAMVRNPYREWIGAQIRADYFGYINPGKPEEAAAMAWRDASISHVKNGIYGEMFVAAMLACAAVCDDEEKVILGGLAQVPATSRLYEDVMKIVEMWRKGAAQEEVFAAIHEQWNEFSAHDWCHTNSNAQIVAASLLYGKGDYGKAICMSVETGFDTDCNGATVGSIVGMMKGSACVGEEWKKPVNGKCRTAIFGRECMSIDQLVDKTLEHL